MLIIEVKGQRVPFVDRRMIVSQKESCAPRRSGEIECFYKCGFVERSVYQLHFSMPMSHWEGKSSDLQGAVAGCFCRKADKSKHRGGRDLVVSLPGSQPAACCITELQVHVHSEHQSLCREAKTGSLPWIKTQEGISKLDNEDKRNCVLLLLFWDKM